MKRVNSQRSTSGFTLIEVIVSLFISLVVLVGILRLYTSIMKSYDLQEQLTEINQNANYAVKRLSDELAQAGADLPGQGFAVIKANSNDYDSVFVYTNPKGAYYDFNAGMTNVTVIPVPDSRPFSGKDTIIAKVDNSTTALRKIAIASVDSISNPNTIVLRTATNFASDDIIFARDSVSFFKSGSNLCMNTPDYVIAENIDSLYMGYFDKNGSVTTTWANMSSLKVVVQVKASKADLKYTHPVYHDHYRRVQLSMTSRFQNRF